MRKTLICTALVVASTVTFALSAEEKTAQEEENIKMLESMGLPTPGSGIRVVPRSTMNLTEEELLKGAKDDEEIRTKGYVNIYTNRARELLDLESTIKKTHALAKQNLSPTSTELRAHAQDIPLAFQYRGLEEKEGLRFTENSLHVIGSAPQGGFHKDKGGWSGITQFFKAPPIGVCAYSVMNVQAANSAARLAQEDVQYLVNNKATLTHVEGSESSGFVYSLKWYDEKNFHELECANMKYSQQTTDAVLQLAKTIDNA